MKFRQGALLLSLSLLAAGLILFAQFSGKPVSAQQPVVSVSPYSQQASVGSQFNVGVTVTDVANLGSFEFILRYDPAIVTYQAVQTGPFLGSTGRQVLCPAPIVDLEAGTVRFGCGSIGIMPGASGSGLLAQITFTAIAEGTSALDLTMVSLSDPLSNDIPAYPQNGSVTVIIGTPGPIETPTPGTPTETPTPGPAPTCNAAPGQTIICVQPAGQVVERGHTFSVNVVADHVTNLGAYQFDLQFDPVVMSYVNAVIGPFLGSTGRTADCLPPYQEGSSVRMVCTTRGAIPAGPSGSGVLATVTFSAIREGVGDLDLANLMLTDISGVTLPIDLSVGAAVVVVPGPTPTEGPSPTPSSTPTATETPLPTPTFTAGPSPTPTPTRTPRPTWTPSPTPTPGPTPTATAVPGPVMVRIAPASQEANVGTPFTVDVVVDNVKNLGAFEFTAGYDPSLLQYAGVQQGPFLKSTGRASQCPTIDVSESSVRMVCVTLGPEPAGPNGSGVLATITFLPLDTATVPVDITIEQVLLTDPMAKTIAAGKQNGWVTIGPALEPTSTPTPGPSPTPTDTRTPGPPGSPTPTATFVPGTTAVMIDPQSQQVAPGEEFTVDVVVQNVANLGAYDFTLIYNPNVINLEGVSNLSFLGSTGRFVSCPPPIADGWVLRFGCVTTGTGIPGPSGSAQLAEIVFRAVDPVPPPGWSTLELQDVGLADPLGAAITAAKAGGTVSVLRPTATATVTPTPTKTFTPTPTDTYTPTPTETFTPTPTETYTPTPTEIYTPTPTETFTPTPTETYTPTPTETFTPTPTETYTPTPTETFTPTPTETYTPTPTETFTPTPTEIDTPTPTETFTPTPTETYTPTPTETFTPTPTEIDTPTPTETFTPTPTETPLSISGAAAAAPGTRTGFQAAAAVLKGTTGLSPESALVGAADPVAMFENPQSANLWLCNEDDGSCEGEGEGRLTINQEVSGIPSGTGLGGFEFKIYYNRQVVNVSVREGPFLGSTGRDTQCSTLAGDDFILFGCVSSGSQPGPHGSGVLAYLDVVPNPDLTLRPTLRNGISVTILNSVPDAELADEMGQPIRIDTTGSADVLVRALEGDLNYDCKVNVVDEQGVSGRYGTLFGIQPYDAFFDLEPIFADQDIDIKDLQFVYGRDSTVCEGPEQPEPTPTPTSVPPTATETPSAPTNTPVPATATFTPAPSTVTPTATPTPSGIASPTPMASPTPKTPCPSATPRPERTRTRTPTPRHSPTPQAGTPTETPLPPPTSMPTSTSTPPGGIEPIGKTPGPTEEVAPEGRVPGTAEALPGAGAGSGGGSSHGGLWLSIASLAFAGWFVVTWMLYRRVGQFSEQPQEAEDTRRDSSRRRAP